MRFQLKRTENKVVVVVVGGFLLVGEAICLWVRSGGAVLKGRRCDELTSSGFL